MPKEKKTTQLNIRISDQQKDKISKISTNLGYNSISKFLIDVALNDVEIKTNDNRKIYVASLSTAIDYFIKTSEIGDNKGGVNKFLKEDKIFAPGGRGINLSKMLNTYNINNLNINFSGGFSGNELYRLLDEQGVKQHRINTGNYTKINVYAEDLNNKDICLEEKTSPISSFAKEEFINFINKWINENDEFVLSGSFAKEDVSFVKRVLKLLDEKKVKIYINSSSSFISQVIGKTKPELIVLCSRNFLGDIKSKKEIYSEMEKFYKLGCKNVAFVADINYSLFMNEEGSFQVSSELIYKVTFLGLEDAFFAGYLANVEKPTEEILKWAAASVRTKAEEKENINFDQIVKYLKEVTVKKN